jgi:hypothetical protein
MEESEILNLVQEMGSALTDYGHVFTNKMRKQYDRVTKELIRRIENEERSISVSEGVITKD